MAEAKTGGEFVPTSWNTALLEALEALPSAFEEARSVLRAAPGYFKGLEEPLEGDEEARKKYRLGLNTVDMALFRVENAVRSYDLTAAHIGRGYRLGPPEAEAKAKPLIAESQERRTSTGKAVENAKASSAQTVAAARAQAADKKNGHGPGKERVVKPSDVKKPVAAIKKKLIRKK